MWKLQGNILETNDKELLVDFIRNTERFTQFEKVKEFENLWSSWQGISYSTYVNSGSSANLIMLDAVKEYYRIEDGAEVLVPAVTWTTNITSVIQAKLTPVFVDVNLDDFSFDYEKLEKSITERTKIILVTHLIGIPANIEKLEEIAKKYQKTPSQIILNWLTSQENVIVAFTSTSEKNIEDNVNALDFELQTEDKIYLDNQFPKDAEPYLK